MKTDPRANVIISKIRESACDVGHESEIPEIKEDEMKQLVFALSLFDKLLPMVVSHVIAEYKRQANK